MLSVTSPAPREVWRDLATSDPTATVFQSPEWLTCVCDVGGYVDASRLYQTSTGRSLVLPVVRSRRLPGRLAWEASLPPFWGAAGLVSGDGPVRVEDVAEVLADLASTAGLFLSVRPHFTQGHSWEAARPPRFAAVSHLVHVVDLDGGFDRVWAERFDRSARGGRRKAERSGLNVEVDTSGRLVPVFYELYLGWHERKARDAGTSPALARRLARHREPMDKFAVVAERLQEACRVWVASHEGIPVAAAIVLVDGFQSYYWRGFSERDAAARTRANDLLQSRIIEDACEAGCRYYNMGESGGVASLMDFKKKFGARPTATPELRYERVPFSRMQTLQAGARRGAQRLMAASKGLGEACGGGRRPTGRGTGSKP